jgi:DNA mismatch endonuclease (patch repair protein)
MADCFTPEFRSEVMSRIRSKGTSPEERLATAVLDALGPGWRIDRNVGALPGRPDVVIPDLGVCIFADGCFFHGCPKHWRAPSTRTEYWVPKVASNKRRDRRHARALRAQGWAVWRLWEHDLTPRAQESIRRRLRARLARIGVEESSGETIRPSRGQRINRPVPRR